MNKPKSFHGYQSQKPRYYRELWNNGPIMVEARRLARQELKQRLAEKGVNINDYSEKAIEKLVTVLVFNSENVYLKRAKFNLGV